MNRLTLIQGGKQKPKPEPCDAPCCAPQASKAICKCLVPCECHITPKKVWTITNAEQLMRAVTDGITKEELNEVLARMS